MRTGSVRPRRIPSARCARSTSARARVSSLRRLTASVRAWRTASGVPVPASTARPARRACSSALARARSEASAISSFAAAPNAACRRPARSCCRAAPADALAAAGRAAAGCRFGPGARRDERHAQGGARGERLERLDDEVGWARGAGRQCPGEQADGRHRLVAVARVAAAGGEGRERRRQRLARQAGRFLCPGACLDEREALRVELAQGSSRGSVRGAVEAASVAARRSGDRHAGAQHSKEGAAWGESAATGGCARPAPGRASETRTRRRNS